MIVCITVPKQHDHYSVHLKGIEDLHHTLEVCLDLDLSRHLGGLASLYRLFTRDVKSPCPLKYRHRYLREKKTGKFQSTEFTLYSSKSNRVQGLKKYSRYKSKKYPSKGHLPAISVQS